MHFTRAFPQHWRNPVFIYMILHNKKDKTQSLQDRVVFRLGVLSENKDTGKIGRMNAVLYLEATE